MKSTIRLALLVGLFGLTCCQEPKTAKTFDREKVRQEFRNMLIDYGVAVERGNADTTISFFSESPDFFINSDDKKYSLDDLKKEIREEWHHKNSPRKLEIKWSEMNIIALSETSAACFAKVEEFETDTNKLRSHPLKVLVDATLGGVKTGNRWKIVYIHAIHKVLFDSTKVK